MNRVNRSGFSVAFTSFQWTGIDTVAPGRARVDNTATAVAVRSLRR